MKLGAKFTPLFGRQQVNEPSEVSSCELPAFGDECGFGRHEFIQQLAVDRIGRQCFTDRLANLMEFFGKDADLFTEILPEFAKSLGLSIVEPQLVRHPRQFGHRTSPWRMPKRANEKEHIEDEG